MFDTAPRKILICGAGVAGPVAAYYLSRIPHAGDLSITIVERSSSPRKTGQAIDIRGPAVPIMRQMGIEEEVIRCTTNEQGLEKLDLNGKCVAYFGATGDAAKQAITSEFEILRADLARICTDKAASIPGVEVVYGEYVASLSQPDDGSGPVRVDFVNGRPSEDFDLVVGADGLMGRARALSSGRPAKADVVHMGGVYLAYLTIPRTAADSSTRSRLYNAPGGRSIMLRPSRLGTGVVLQIRRPGDAELDAAVASQDMATQKALVSRLFADAGWEAKRVLEGIAASDDFYLQAQAQVRAPTWSKGRVVLIGDAAYCSTRGMGTTLAMYGAYTLAGELTKAIRSGGTVPDALAAYERELRPYVQGIQKTPPGIRAIQLPHSRTGVWLLNSFLQFITWSGVLNLFNFEGKGEDQVKQYEWAT